MIKIKVNNLSKFIFILILLLTNHIKCISQPIIWDYERLQETKSNPSSQTQLLNNYRKYADKFVASPPIYVTNKDNKLISDTHNYVSLAIYYWPPKDSVKTQWEHRDGEVNPAYKSYDGRKLELLEDRLRTLSIGYYLTGDSHYRDTYIQQIKAWFIDKQTYMYPNFNYAQIIPDKHIKEGQPWGLIEAYQFNSVLESIRLMDYLGQIDLSTMKLLKKWFKQFSKWMESSPQGKEVAAAINNQSIAYDVTLLNMKLFYNGKIDRHISDNFRTKRLLRQISSDGSQPEELKRTRAIHYSVYNLSHIIDFCRIMQHTGVDYYIQNKDLIDKAFSYLLKTTNSPQSFSYKELNWDESVQNLYRECTRIHYNIEKKNDFYRSPHTLHL